MQFAPEAHETITCAGCGVEMTRYVRQKRKYHSQECMWEHRRRLSLEQGLKLKAICPNCGDEFEYNRCWPRKYCRKACQSEAVKKGEGAVVYKRTKAICEQCGDEFTYTPGQTQGRFCSTRCHGKWMSANLVGENHPKHGKKVGRHSYLPPPTVINCEGCGQPFPIKPGTVSRRKCCSKTCQAIHYQTAMTGENNPVWTGGYDPYYGPSWRAAQRAARERDGKCRDCGATPEELGYQLAVHHTMPFSVFGKDRHEEANRLSNLESLCSHCHGKRRKQDHLIRKQVKTGSLFPDFK